MEFTKWNEPYGYRRPMGERGVEFGLKWSDHSFKTSGSTKLTVSVVYATSGYTELLLHVDRTPTYIIQAI